MKLKNRMFKYLFLLIALLSLTFVIPLKLSALDITKKGIYEAPIKLDLKMGADAFSDKVIIEHDDYNYYLTFTQVDSSNLTDMKIHLGGNTGEIIRVNGKEKIYTYTLTYDDLTKPIKFSVTVTVMNKYVEFYMNINLDEAKYLGDSLIDLGERPARFVPVLTTNATDGEFEHLSSYLIRECKATLENEEIAVKTKVYYLQDGKLEEVKVNDGLLKFDEIGEYHLVYEAESDLYKTSLGNNTKTVLDIKLISKVGANTLGKLEANEGILPIDYMLQTTIIKNGEVYDKVKKKMAKLADNYQIFNVNLYNNKGDEINLTEDVLLYLMIDESYNRKEVKGYYLDEAGNYNKIELENYGRYVRFNTKEVGNFIIYVPGVEFHMPIWGYALIGLGVVLVLASAITIPLVIHHKKNKKNLKEL